MRLGHAASSHAQRARALDLPRLSRHVAFWAVAGSLLAVSALSTAPSSLYGLYARHDHFSGLTVTIVYAVYAAGVVLSLLLAGHLSDWYGRRAVLLPALGVAVAAAMVFLLWRSLAGLLLARGLSGVALGAAAATATAFVADLDGAPGAPPSPRAGVVATTANLGGLALGPLIAGLLARYATHPLTLPFLVFLGGLLVALALVLRAPEGHPAVYPRPRYRPQRLAAPADARGPFLAAMIGAFSGFAVSGLFAGLAGTLLAGPLHHGSPALIGLTIFLNFGAGVLAQTLTSSWPAHRLVAAGVPPMIVGVATLVVSAWTSPPSLTLFLVAAAVAGAGVGAIFRGSLSVVIAVSRPDDRAGALASLFTAGYAGVSLPVLGLGIALQHLSPRVTLLIFGLAVGLGVLAVAPVLTRPSTTPAPATEPDADPMTSLPRCFGATT